MPAAAAGSHANLPPPRLPGAAALWQETWGLAGLVMSPSGPLEALPVPAAQSRPGAAFTAPLSLTLNAVPLRPSPTYQQALGWGWTLATGSSMGSSTCTLVRATAEAKAEAL